MKQTRMYVRVDVQELEEWKAAAMVDGKLLSEWVRGLCNEAAVGRRGAETGKGDGGESDG